MIANALTRLGRETTAFWRRNSRLRHYVPLSAVKQYNRLRSKLTEYRSLVVPVTHPSPLQNIYHCTFHKCGSVWVKTVLADMALYPYYGLAHYHHQTREPRPVQELRDKKFPGFPTGTLISPLYITADNFDAMAKPEPYRGFFMLRDPRDMLVSSYFSTLKTHLVEDGSPLAKRRADLQALDKEDGLIYMIDHWNWVGIFEEQVRWVEYAAENPAIRIVRYEDLVATPYESFQALFDHLQIPVPEDEARALVDAYSFKRLSGRESGQADANSHLRSGKSGDWRNHFTERVSARFEEASQGSVETVGYDAT